MVELDRGEHILSLAHVRGLNVTEVSQHFRGFQKRLFFKKFKREVDKRIAMHSSTNIRHSIWVFADGSCQNNPGPGGWAYLILEPSGLITEESGPEAKTTTNNRMELCAIIQALKELEGSKEKIHCFLDSDYVLKGITDWIVGWRKKAWIGSQGAVKNQDLWKTLDELSKNLTIRWNHIRAHKGLGPNERVDFLAQEACKRQKSFRQKLSIEKTQVFSLFKPERDSTPRLMKIQKIKH